MIKSLLFPFFLLIALEVFPARITPGDSLKLNHGYFKQIEANPATFISPLPETVKETSGLIFWRNALWTHNDSGGKPEIYKIDTATGKIVQTVRLNDARNIDWEDITQDNDNIFIGDFGNNSGARKDLSIYKISKSQIPINGKNISLYAEQIRFSYDDQKNFEKRNNRNDYDCEAFFALGDSLFLFTKDWVDENTRLYALPKIEGEYHVSPHNFFSADGLITGADISPSRKEVALIGYKDFQSFMWIFWDFNGHDFFNGEKLRVNFPDLVFVQTEGIAYINDDMIFFSNEESAVPPGVYEVNSATLKTDADKHFDSFQSSEITISKLPGKFSNLIQFSVISLPKPHFSVELRNKKWKKLFKYKFVKYDKYNPIEINIPIEKLKSGTYFIKILCGGQSLVRKINIEN